MSGRLKRNSWATWLRVAFPITTQGKPVPFVRRREVGCKIRRSVSPSSLQTPPCLNLRGPGHPPETQVFICPHFPNLFLCTKIFSFAEPLETGPPSPQNMVPAIQTYMFFFLIFFRTIHAITGCLRLPPRTFTCGCEQNLSSSFAKLKVSYKEVVVS